MRELVPVDCRLRRVEHRLSPGSGLRASTTPSAMDEALAAMVRALRGRRINLGGTFSFVAGCGPMRQLLAIVLTIFALTTAAMVSATLTYSPAVADCDSGCN